VTDTETTPVNVEGYVAMIYHYWGWGATIPDAVARLRKACGGRESVAKGKRLVVKMPPGSQNVWVDDMGAFRWTWAEGADNTAVLEVIEEPKR